MTQWISASKWIFFIFLGYVCVPAKAQCSNSLTITVNSTEQTILSPNYPGFYPRPSSCTWYLVAERSDDVIVFRYRYFNIYTSIFCYLDTFSITDGDNGWLPEIMSLCGSFSSDSLLRTTRPAAIVSFGAATNGGQGEGFNISVWAEAKETPKMGSAQYSLINYVGMILSGCVVTALVAACAFLIIMHFREQPDQRYKPEQ